MCDACGCGSNTDTVVLNVEGMTCNHCKMAVEKALLKLNGVVSAEVNLADKNVVVNFVNGTAGVGQMKDAVTAAGYKVAG